MARGKRATEIFRRKVTYEDQWLIEAVIWKVPVSPHYPEGVRYRLAAIPPGRSRPVILYDNHRGKGHHRHVLGRQYNYAFVDVSRLRKDFESDVKRVKSGGRSQ